MLDRRQVEHIGLDAQGTAHYHQLLHPLRKLRLFEQGDGKIGQAADGNDCQFSPVFFGLLKEKIYGVEPGVKFMPVRLIGSEEILASWPPWPLCWSLSKGGPIPLATGTCLPSS